MMHEITDISNIKYSDFNADVIDALNTIPEKLVDDIFNYSFKRTNEYCVDYDEKIKFAVFHTALLNTLINLYVFTFACNKMTEKEIIKHVKKSFSSLPEIIAKQSIETRKSDANKN